MAELADIAADFPWFFPSLAFLFGAIVGSFLNVCIYRIPAGKSVVRPGSHCACGKPVAWRDNIPILSWIFLRGRARCCGRRFSVRYPAIELLTGLLFLACAWQFSPAKALSGMLFLSLLVAAAFIDLDHMIIPERFSVGGAVIGVLLSFTVPSLHGYAHDFFLAASLRSGIDGVLGLLVGSGLVLWIAVVAEKLLRKEAMGFGDVMLMGCIGAFCGWQGALFAVFGGAVLGTLVAVPALLLGRVFSNPSAAIETPPAGGASRPEPTAPRPAETAAAGEAFSASPPGDGVMGRQIPFGPMLSAAGALYFLFLRPYVDGYFALLAEVLFFEP